MKIIAKADRNRNGRTNWAAVIASRVLLTSTLLFNSGRAAARMPNATCVSVSTQDTIAPTLVIGFVGGLVHRDDIRHSEVLLAHRLQARYGGLVEVEIFENRRRAEAKQLIVRWLNGLNYRPCASEQVRQPKIILFGHSWGASAVVYLARELGRECIPIVLTVQVDSIRKHGDDDSLIPPNVAEAVNFYQSTGLIHGRERILPADPSRTKILGNFHFKYHNEPAECRTYPWYDHLLFKGHTSIECDPRLWSEVEALIENRLTANLPAQAAVAAQPSRQSSCQDAMLPKPDLARSGPDTAFVKPRTKIQ